MNTRSVSAALLPLLLAAGGAWAEDLDQRAQSGRVARDEGHYEEARRLLGEGYAAASDAATRSRLAFDLALTYQLEGEAKGNDRRFLEKALVLYSEVLAVRPASAATLCNQARAHARLGNWPQAEARYAEAAALEGPDQPFYQRKQAEYLAERGEWQKAAPLYEAIALARPESREAHEVLLRHYREVSAGNAVRAYLWRLVEAGEGERAAEAAVDELERSGASLDLQASSDLLAIAASGESQSLIDPEAFLASPLAKRLADLSDHPAAGQGAKELLVAVGSAREPGSPEELALRLGWWRSVPPRAKGDPPRGVWAPDAMRSLLLSLGRWHAQNGRPGLAETYLRTAIILVAGRADPGALRALLDLFVANNELDGVEKVLGEFEDRLFEAKGQAYRNSDLAEIYRFHTTLGSLYGYLASQGKRSWGASGDVRSAVFQLERALEVGRELDQQQAPGAAKHLHLEPSTVEYLARAYEATGQKARSTAVRLDGAARFKAAGNARASAVVLEPVKLEQLEGSDRLRVEELRRVKPEELERQKLDPELVKKLKIDVKATAVKPPGP